MKKEPLKRYYKEFLKAPLIATMAQDSKNRESGYLKTGCNSFDNKISVPMGFWTEQNVLQYLKVKKVKYCNIYGNIVKTIDGDLVTTKAKRTGCFACMFGVHLEKGMNRFQRMETTHPKLHKFCLENLGLREVLDFMDVPHSRPRVVKAKYKLETTKISCRVETEKLNKLKSMYGNLTSTELIDKLINEKLSDTLSK